MFYLPLVYSNCIAVVTQRKKPAFHLFLHFFLGRLDVFDCISVVTFKDSKVEWKQKPTCCAVSCVWKGLGTNRKVLNFEKGHSFSLHGTAITTVCLYRQKKASSWYHSILDSHIYSMTLFLGETRDLLQYIAHWCQNGVAAVGEV